ncbi:MAG: SocA family protein, partial [Alphaproteobacteria bacterium]|nr:SocA family protein [Alphaproteobacteria bacterium]
GGGINIVKLMKLLYLAERESMRRYDLPILGDHYVSMAHGPVLSRTYDLLNGAARGQCASQWKEWISGRDQHEIRAQSGIREEMLDRTSIADMEVLNAVWDAFGGFAPWDLVEYTHKNCPEWKDPGDSSAPIAEEEIFRALGKSESVSREIADEIRGQRELDRIFASL